MPKLAAIDVGSNAIRMVVSQVQPGFTLKILKSIREPVRLGRDVFGEGEISERTLKKAVDAFRKFRRLLDVAKVDRFRAVATSATREAHNRELFLDAIQRETGIEVQPIAGEEEARLVYLAVNRRLPLGEKTTLVVDIGGGSVELIFGANGQVQALESLKMGTVRMLARLREAGGESPVFLRRAREYVESTRAWVEQKLGQQKVEILVATGGNAEELGSLARKVFAKERDDFLTIQELDLLVERLESLTYQERIQKYNLRPDRADVILPAAIVLQTLLRQAKAESILIPHVGLKDGVLLDLMMEHLGERGGGCDRAQVLAAAQSLGRKYQYDQEHARKVADLALQLFDQTKPLHGLTDADRFLLEIASMLHDVGKFIASSGHHKHSHYIIAHSPIFGLSEAQKAIVGNVARYHRKAAPSLQHEPFRALSAHDRLVVTKLSALLRVAEALDAEHGGKVDSLQAKLSKNRILLTLQGNGELLLERWSAEKKGLQLDKALGAKLVLV